MAGASRSTRVEVATAGGLAPRGLPGLGEQGLPALPLPSASGNPWPGLGVQGRMGPGGGSCRKQGSVLGWFPGPQPRIWNPVSLGWPHRGRGSRDAAGGRRVMRPLCAGAGLGSRVAVVQGLVHPELWPHANSSVPTFCRLALQASRGITPSRPACVTGRSSSSPSTPWRPHPCTRPAGAPTITSRSPTKTSSPA